MIRRDEVYKIGKLGKPHGVKGEITFAITDDVFDRVDAEYLVLDIDGILVPFYLEEYRFKNDENVLVKFEDIDTQEQARNYTGCEVFFPRHLSDSDEENMSWAEIIGFHLVDAVSGKVVEVNEALEDAPELINQDAYANWIIKVELADASELDNLMDAKAYEEFCNK